MTLLPVILWVISIENVGILSVGSSKVEYVTKPTRSTQPCIPLGSLNRVPALIGWSNGGKVTSAGWQVILCMIPYGTYVSSRSGVVLVAQTAIRFLLARCSSLMLIGLYSPLQYLEVFSGVIWNTPKTPMHAQHGKH